jgi:hypothetical protein
MKNKQQVGIFMDHSNAHIMEFTVDPIETTTIESTFTHQVKEDTLEKSEYLMHNKEQHQQAAFYKKLCDVIKHYDAVLLFGPTEAKVELFNILKADNAFEKINITIMQADKMTENQQHAFVKDFFTLHKII